MQKIVYRQIEDQGCPMNYGYWQCPECDSQFAGGGNAIHKSGCSKTTYEELIYCYSREEADLWNKEVLERGFVAHLPLSPLGLPDFLLKRAIAERTIDVDKVRQITQKHVVSINPRYLPSIMKNLEELIASG